MASKVLLQLKEKLSPADFDLFCSLIVLTNEVRAEQDGQTRISLEFVRENLERRYRFRLFNVDKVLSLSNEDIEELLLESDYIDELNMGSV